MTDPNHPDPASSAGGVGWPAAPLPERTRFATPPGTPPGAQPPAEPEPVPGLPEPVLPDPVLPDPVLPDPVLPDPGAPSPETPEPVRPAPPAPEPVLPDPVLPQPGQPEPVTPQPPAPEPVLPDPVLPELPEPVLAEPEPAEPEPAPEEIEQAEAVVAPEPVAPAAAEAAAGTPVAAEPSTEQTGTEEHPTVPSAPAARGRGLVAVAAFVVLVLAALTGFLAWRAQDTQGLGPVAAARSSALDAARTSARLVFSYDYRHLAQDFKAGRAVTTGQFQGEYDKTTAKLVTDVAPRYKAVVVADVSDAGVVSATSSQVVALVFLNQQSSSSLVAQPKITQSRLEMTLVRRDGRWLVEKIKAL